MLGRLHYRPDELGRCRIGDIFDAMIGHNEEVDNRFRSNANLVRTATALLWNIQVKEECQRTEEELWRFLWETEGDNEMKLTGEEMEQVRKNEEAQKEYLINHF